MRKQIKLQGSVAISAGHAIYHHGRWYGGFKGEDSFYARHVETGIELLKNGFDYWVPSGGPTRPRLEKETEGVSEAAGMVDYAVQNGLCSGTDDRIIKEDFARDSGENLFFSILAFHRRTGDWPAKVAVVSWSSKGLRYHLIASGMHLGGRMFFHGVGDYPSQADLERACAAEARFNATIVDVAYTPPSYKIVDPLLRNISEFAQKRWSRMPSKFTPDPAGNKAYIEEVKNAYAAEDNDVRELIDSVESLQPGDGWRHIRWPWV